MKQRVLSLVIALAMALSLLPSVALAADEPEASGSAPETAETQPTEAEVLPPVEETNDPTPETPETEPVVPADLVPASAEETSTPVPTADDGYTEWTNSNSLPTSGTYRLMSNVTISSQVTIGSWASSRPDSPKQTLVLDLNGHTITASGGQAFFIQTNGGLTIQDSQGSGKITNAGVTASSKTLIQVNGGWFTLEGGMLENVTSSGYALFLNSDSTAEISDGTVVNKANGGKALFLNSSSSLTMTGGEVIQESSYSSDAAIYANNSASSIEISGGTVTSATMGVYAAFTPVTVTGGTFDTESYAFHTRHATIASENNEDLKVESGAAIFYSFSGSENKIDGGTFTAPTLSKEYTREEESSLTISGGTFTGLSDTIVSGSNTDVTISGGSFTGSSGQRADVSQYLDGSCEQDENGQVLPLTEENAVAEMDGKYYKTLADAIENAEAGDTVKLLKSTEGSGIVIPSGSNLTIDLNGCIYTVGNPTVGSSGTETNGFQLLKDSTITFKNGTIKAGTDAAKILIQNYSNLTLENVTLDGTDSSCDYMLSNNNGDVLIKDSTINAPANSFAFDVCWGPNSGYPDGTQVTVEGNSKINGKVEIGVWGDLTGQTDSKSTLHITGGEFNGEIVVNDALKDQAKEGNVSISGGTFQNASGNPIDVSDYVVPGMKQDDDGNIVVDAATAVAEVNGMGYTDLQDAIDAAEATNGTVELIAGKTIEITTALTIEEPITIEGNGSTITAKGCSALTIKDDLNALTVKDLTLKGELETATATEGVGPNVGIGTYSPDFYGVGKLQLTNVVIDGFCYGLSFTNNPTGDVTPVNNNPVSIGANNLTIQNCYIKGAYFEKLTDSTFTNCTIKDNGSNAAMVSSQNDWLCGIDINLKNGSYENIIFDGCTFTGNGANRGTALHIKARDDGSYQDDKAATLDGVTVEDCTFKDNNQPNDKDEPIVLGEPGASNKTPINVSIQPDVNFTDNLAQGETYTVTFDSNGGSDVPTRVVADNAEITLPTPTRSGYRFRNWSDGSSTYDAGDTVKITADTTFTASWSRISSGSSGSSSSNDYSITVDAGRHGDVTVRPSRAEQGETVTITVEPDTGYELDELIVTDSDGDEISVRSRGNGRYTFEMPRGRVTVEATFVAVEDSGLPFLDVASDAWYYDAVAYVYENGMMNGTSSNVFSPNATTTRGMIVTMLYRLEGEPRVSGTSTFDDVANGMYYADAIAWAAGNDIVTGYDDTTFGPNDAITREQMAAILYRYAQYKGYRTTASADLSGYVDAGDVSSYALSALQWASAEGLVTGTSSTALTPDGSATRAQVATIFMRFMEDVAK